MLGRNKIIHHWKKDHKNIKDLVCRLCEFSFFSRFCQKGLKTWVTTPLLSNVQDICWLKFLSFAEPEGIIGKWTEIDKSMVILTSVTCQGSYWQTQSGMWWTDRSRSVERNIWLKTIHVQMLISKNKNVKLFLFFHISGVERFVAGEALTLSESVFVLMKTCWSSIINHFVLIQSPTLRKCFII